VVSLDSRQAKDDAMLAENAKDGLSKVCEDTVLYDVSGSEGDGNIAVPLLVIVRLNEAPRTVITSPGDNC